MAQCVSRERFLGKSGLPGLSGSMVSFMPVFLKINSFHYSQLGICRKGLFAGKVVLVEGVSDKAFFEILFKNF